MVGFGDLQRLCVLKFVARSVIKRILLYNCAHRVGNGRRVRYIVECCKPFEREN